MVESCRQTISSTEYGIKQKSTISSDEFIPDYLVTPECPHFFLYTRNLSDMKINKLALLDSGYGFNTLDIYACIHYIILRHYDIMHCGFNRTLSVVAIYVVVVDWVIVR